MKRLKHVWEKIVSQTNITEAVYNAIENKHIDEIANIRELKEVVSNAAKCGIFKQAGSATA